MQAKRVEIAASKLKGPDDIDLRAIKKAAKLAEKARLAAEELENEGGAGCVLSWEAPGGTKEVVPAKVLFHQEAPAAK